MTLPLLMIATFSAMVWHLEGLTLEDNNPYPDSFREGDYTMIILN